MQLLGLLPNHMGAEIAVGPGLIAVVGNPLAAVEGQFNLPQRLYKICASLGWGSNRTILL